MVSWPIVTVQGRSAVAADRWRTRANALSLLRLVVAPALAAAIIAAHAELATALFALAVATDFADGAVARRYGESSPLGGLLDHAIDATFCVLGLAAHAAAGVVPWSLPFLVAAAFAQYVVDSKSLAGRPLRASRLGRWNGIAYYVAVAVPIVRDTLGWSWPGAALVRWLAAALVATTLVSMADRALALVRPPQA
ncbi:MAG: pgsA [Deltaproteobacteria bacterium]|nr:pgsA [Deltaproteobacteria bacterium]